tara:strand:- start:1021 stop:1368 length:348 start_codon:yes stop_codon:yes gene_type:complete
MKMSYFPIIKQFHSSSYVKAFILNAIVGAIICGLAIELRMALHDNTTHYYQFVQNLYNVKHITKIHKLIATLVSTLIVSIITYIFMYFIFSYGGGELSKVGLKRATWSEMIKERL